MTARLLLLICIILQVFESVAQENARGVYDRCGTMQRLESQFESQPLLRIKFEEKRRAFNAALREGKLGLSRSSNLRVDGDARKVYTIPVVFHIVLPNPNIVTDAQIEAQLNTLNKSFFGSNEDSVKISSGFKPLFGKSGIQFCLAQRDPNNESTTGIQRITSSQSSFSTNDAVKHRSSGGSDYWDNNKYFNIWITSLSNNILGYATFPDDGLVDDQGVVVDYRSLPGSSSPNYNTGKTLVHETGHYFNLYHIWGDDNGACTGTDYIDDTPNQGAPSSGCYNGIKTDNCTAEGPGIMYQNYMDYSYDACMLMFTKQQVLRMEAALATSRSSLLNSNGCLPPVVRNYDVQLKTIVEPEQRICSNSFTPVVTIRNRGVQNITSLTITTRINNSNITSYQWTGSLATFAQTQVTLNNVTTTPGNHTIAIYVSQPNGAADEDPTNDTLSLAFQYYPAVTSVSESFEGPVFPPLGWDIVNHDNAISWKRVVGVARSGNASVMIDNFNYSGSGQRDDVRLPEVNLSNVDSAFLSFHVAAAVFTSLNTFNNAWDTLEVLVSTDCGRTYSSLYKRFAGSLITKTAVTTSSFTPAANEWRRDSINLANYLNRPNVLIAFRSINGHENVVYLDDVTVRTVVINPNLKSQGILITPNPTSGLIAVQFYPPPANLKGIQVYSLTGQKITEVAVNGRGNNLYNLNINNQPAGTYIIKVVYSDRVVTRKIIKL